MVSADVCWWALIHARLAVLDGRFTNRMCPYPEVIGALSGRLEQRSPGHALRFAIMQQPHLEERLRLLLWWHFADRFGRLHPEGWSCRCRYRTSCPPGWSRSL